MGKLEFSGIGGSDMRKWYSLIDKVYAPENLRRAFKHVKSNNGAPGIDGETVKDFAMSLENKLAIIHDELKTGRYRPCLLYTSNLNHLLNCCVCYKRPHTIIDFPTGKNNLTVIAQFFGFINKVIGVHTYTMSAD